ncbi:MAG: hypothetical protein R6U17_07865 [Thermoplasmata archaeon]
MKKTLLVIVICVISLVLLSTSAVAQNDGTGIGVLNVPPTFVSIDIQEADDYIYIEALISDYNGRGDIYSLNVHIFDPNENLLSNFSYYQWDSTDRATASRIDAFVDHDGDYLVRKECSMERYVGPDWFLENTTIKIRFVVRPLEGETIVMTARDMKQTEAFYEGPIASKVIAPPIIQGQIIPLFISAMVASLITAVVIYDRRNKNALAMAVREKMEEEIG